MASRELTADDIDLADRAFWAQSAADRDRAFDVLRRERPVARYRAADSPLLPPDDDSPGFWAVTRHADVRMVSRAPDVFCSGKGVILDDVPEMLLEASQSFLAMDAPRHTQIRGLVSKAFTPRQMRRIEAEIAAQATRIVDDFLETGEGDFVQLVSMRLPMMTINALLGVPEADQARLARAADEMVGWNDPELVGDEEPIDLLTNGLVTVHEAAEELIALRRAQPADDLMSALVQAEVDGERLTDAEIGAFLVLLTVAGNDTSRHTTSEAVAALWRDFPDQRRVLCEDVPGRIEAAIEECLRWTTPVMTFRRTATRDTEIAGQPIAAGDKVVMIYRAANRDEDVFADPYAFDVLRSPNRHVAFGGGGPHFCLGASLARTQLRCIVAELLTRVDALELGDSEYLVANFISGMKRMPVRVRAA
jgi:cytochrome P450